MYTIVSHKSRKNDPKSRFFDTNGAKKLTDIIRWQQNDSEQKFIKKSPDPKVDNAKNIVSNR